MKIYLFFNEQKNLRKNKNMLENIAFGIEILTINEYNVIMSGPENSKNLARRLYDDGTIALPAPGIRVRQYSDRGNSLPREGGSQRLRDRDRKSRYGERYGESGLRAGDCCSWRGFAQDHCRLPDRGSDREEYRFHRGVLRGRRFCHRAWATTPCCPPRKKKSST